VSERRSRNAAQRRISAPHEPAAEASEDRLAMQDGIAYLHKRLGANAARTLESAAFTYALIELLTEQGLIAVEDLDARKHSVAERLLDRFQRNDPGVAIQDSPHDKYDAPEEAVIDCASRVSLCRAACCKMQFPLSRQDIEERIIQWDLGRPYLIAKGDDGYCRHLDRGCLGCTEHKARPLPCRVYDCRRDPRIWLDFEARRINPKIADPEWPHNLSDAEREPWGHQGPDDPTQNRKASA
jgi:Fe-S-cluster containining protein